MCCAVVYEQQNVSVLFAKFFVYFNNHSSKIYPVIHVFSLALYSIGFVFKFLKQRGFSDFPIIINGSFSVPSVLAPIKRAIRTLLFFTHCNSYL